MLSAGNTLLVRVTLVSQERRYLFLERRFGCIDEARRYEGKKRGKCYEDIR